ncbi:MAG: carboxypeptidase-like regulatory domain-containing protein [Halanaerobium sp.]|nr:carboxypeptidase-like regulatory domain-containing protein [Halanaerobium sp.]
MKRRLSLSIILLLVALVAFGCGQQAPEINSTITGVVTSSRGGAAEPGVDITIGDYSATTDGNGEFTLQVPEGTYDVYAVKEGFGTSRYQSVSVGPESPAHLKMIIRFESGASPEAPTITVTGISAGDELSGVVTYTIDIAAETSLNYININYGKEGYLTNDFYVNQDHIVTSWDTTLYPNGESYLTVEVDDSNHNVTKIRIPVTINNPHPPNGLVPPDVVPYVEVVAMTWGKQEYGFFSTEPTPVILKNGKEIIVQNVPADTTLYNLVYWDPVTGAEGYTVYRSYDGTNFEVAGTIPGNTLMMVDMDPALTPGEPVYYKIEAYNDAGSSGLTSAVMTIPLPGVNVYLLEPENESTGAPINPTFTWELSREPVSYEIDGTTYTETFYYLFAILDVNYYYLYQSTINLDTCSFYPDYYLDPMTAYQWNIEDGYSEIVFTDETDANGTELIGYSHSNYGYRAGSLNGGFTFVTGTIED